MCRSVISITGFWTYVNLVDLVIAHESVGSRPPSWAEQAYTLYALPDRVESLPPNATERELWAAVRQAIQDGKEDAEMWAKEGGE